MKETKIKNDKAFTVVINEDTGCATVYWQTLNPKTGQPWQRQRDNQYFSGDGFKPRAMRAWLYAK